MSDRAEKPIRVLWSELGQRFYATQQYRIKGSTLIVTGKKFDVTDDIAAAITRHHIEFFAAVIPRKRR